MPVYEFRCLECGKRFSVLVGVVAESGEERCPHCASIRMEKLVSRVARVRTEDDRMLAVADELEAMGMPDSPQAMRRMVREAGKALDEDLADEMEEMLEEDLSQESAEEVEE